MKVRLYFDSSSSNLRSRADGLIEGFSRLFDRRPIIADPLNQMLHRFQQAETQRSEFVLHSRRNLRKAFPFYEAIPYQVAQRGRKHSLRDPIYQPVKF